MVELKEKFIEKLMNIDLEQLSLDELKTFAEIMRAVSEVSGREYWETLTDLFKTYSKANELPEKEE